MAVIAHGFFVQNVESESQSYMVENIFIVDFAEIWLTRVKMSRQRTECFKKLTKLRGVLIVNLECRIG